MTAVAKGLGQQDVPGRSSPLSPTIMSPSPRDRRDDVPGSNIRDRPNAFVKRYRTEIAASTSSVFSTLTAFPLDSVKTRMQTYHYRGFLDCVKHTYQTEKLGGFFRGVLKRLSAVRWERKANANFW